MKKIEKKKSDLSKIWIRLVFYKKSLNSNLIYKKNLPQKSHFIFFGITKITKNASYCLFPYGHDAYYFFV